MRLPLWIGTTIRRRLFEVFGSRRFSRPAYAGIDDRLLQYLPRRGFFVEAGAVDGFFESNTYFLERFHGWRGVLVEPVPRMFKRIRFNRPRAIAFNCVLVGQSFQESHAFVWDAHAVSHVVSSGASLSPAGCVTVPARTLSSILDEVGAPPVDLLSLDVEGFELEVLKGLDFERHAPRLVLVECLSDEAREEMKSFLGDRYVLIEALDERDFLFRRR